MPFKSKRAFFAVKSSTSFSHERIITTFKGNTRTNFYMLLNVILLFIINRPISVLIKLFSFENYHNLK